MRNLIISICAGLMLVSCGNGTQKKSVEQTDNSTVNVYYFHGKQRCKTCVAVGNVTKETVKTTFANNSNVKFTEILIAEKEFENLIEKYEISWNALIIAKGDEYVDITNDAFATAVNSPEVLANQIKTEVNKFLE